MWLESAFAAALVLVGGAFGWLALRDRAGRHEVAPPASRGAAARWVAPTLGCLALLCWLVAAAAVAIPIWLTARAGL